MNQIITDTANMLNDSLNWSNITVKNHQVTAKNNNRNMILLVTIMSGQAHIILKSASDGYRYHHGVHSAYDAAGFQADFRVNIPV